MHRRIVVTLRDAVGLGGAVQRRVLAREHRGPAREAGGRTDVVAVELEPAVAQRLPGGQALTPEPAKRVVLVGRRIALLVGQDHEHVRRVHSGPSPRGVDVGSDAG